MNVELSIKASYLPKWGAYEGIREFIQNAKDADTEGHEMKVCFQDGLFTIENLSVVLSHKALLFGHSTKTENDKQIGQFGEGLKLGSLALIRKGYSIKIHSGEEVWIPYIDNSPFYEEEVLFFNVTKTEYINKTIVYIDITREEWESFSQNFLFIKSPQKIWKSINGSVILDPEYKGRIFVKGIFVQEEQKAQCGYNFSNVDVDRDRQMVNYYDLFYNSYSMLMELSHYDELFEPLYDLFEQNAEDIKYFSKHSYVNSKFLKYACERWVTQYGKDVFPVKNNEEAKRLEFLGCKSVVVDSKPLVDLLYGEMKDFEEKVRNLTFNIVKVYQLSELTIKERINFLRASSIVKKILQVDLNIEIVRFNRNVIRGAFINGQVYISQDILNNFSAVLVTLMHEVAHFSGGDGDQGHVQAMEALWTKYIDKIEKNV